jgi:hypothetical protein
VGLIVGIIVVVCVGVGGCCVGGTVGLGVGVVVGFGFSVEMFSKMTTAEITNITAINIEKNAFLYRLSACI